MNEIYFPLGRTVREFVPDESFQAVFDAWAGASGYRFLYQFVESRIYQKGWGLIWPARMIQVGLSGESGYIHAWVLSRSGEIYLETGRFFIMGIARAIGRMEVNNLFARLGLPLIT